MEFVLSRSLRRSLAFASLVLVALLISTASASAVPRTPSISGTHPTSPGLSTTPRVHGIAREVITSGTRIVKGPFTAAIEEPGTVKIFANGSCTGAELASGSNLEFEGSGIPVAVGKGSITTFHATTTDATGVSACSNGYTYRHVEDPPGPATVSGVTPASPADANTPSVHGSADPEATVEIFTNPACSGEPLASGTAAEFAGSGIQVVVGDDTTTTFYARAVWAELPAPCSTTSITYQEVSGESVSEPPPAGPPGSPPPPAGSPPSATNPNLDRARPVPPRIHVQPGGRANDANPRVAGSAPGASGIDLYRNAACSGGPAATVTPAELSAGVRLQVAENAETVFYARSFDAAGASSKCSEQATYIEDSAPPVTRITFGPGVKTRKRSVVFRFTDLSGDPPGTVFLCKLDRRPWRQCHAPWKLSRLAPKSHLVKVKAIDPAGNEETAAAKRRFKVIAAAKR
jgi:hypothetical protein